MAGAVAAVAAGSVAAAQVNVNYTRILSPVAGRVGVRLVDAGNLVSTTDTTGIIIVNEVSPIAVTFTVPQHPGRVFHAKLVASAGAVASSTGTVLVQFGLDNTDNALQPGAYAEVKFPLPAGANGIRVPATALMFRDEGMQVATVDATNHVKLKTVNIARDLGASVDVGGGISPKDRIIDNPADALRDGDEVRITKP